MQREVKLSHSWDMRVKATYHAWSLTGDRMEGQSLKWVLGWRNVFGGINYMGTAIFDSLQVSVSRCEETLGHWWGVHWYPTSGDPVFRMRSWIWRAVTQKGSSFIWPLNAWLRRSMTAEIYWECTNLTWSECFCSTVSPKQNFPGDSLKHTENWFLFPFSLGPKVEGKSQKLGGLSSLLFECSKIPCDGVLDKKAFKLGLWRIVKPGETRLTFVQSVHTLGWDECSVVHN